MLKLFKYIFIIFFPVLLRAESSAEYEKLPNCGEDSTPGYAFIIVLIVKVYYFIFSLAIVSTIDGIISAINAKGGLEWQLDTGPGPLLTSNIHNLEVLIYLNLLFKTVYGT